MYQITLAEWDRAGVSALEAWVTDTKAWLRNLSSVWKPQTYFSYLQELYQLAMLTVDS
jgi:hypothetical protein